MTTPSPTIQLTIVLTLGAVAALAVAGLIYQEAVGRQVCSALGPVAVAAIAPLAQFLLGQRAKDTQEEK